MSVFEHPWLSGLFADPEMQALWSAEAQLEHMLAFEAAWSRHGHIAGLWSAEDGAAAAAAVEATSIDPEDLAAGTARDGVCVPDLVRLLRAQAGDAVHRGATSQDVIDTALARSMVAALDLLSQRVAKVGAGLNDLKGRFGDLPLMGRTRMQSAVEITCSDRIENWRLPLGEHKRTLEDLRPRIGLVQIGGPAGNRADLKADPDGFARAVAGELGLESAPYAWHARREGVAGFANALAMVTGSLGKMGQDLCLMAQMGEVEIEGGGGSSAMPHKQNPVLAELLVTLARFNAVQVSAIHHAMVHEQERSGSAWTLEWMVLPEMAKSAGRSLAVAKKLTKHIKSMG